MFKFYIAIKKAILKRFFKKPPAVAKKTGFTNALPSADKKLVEKLPGDLKRIAEEVGLNNALKISAIFGGVSIYIPACAQLRRERRNQKIRSEYDAGSITVKNLASKYSLTERQTFTILSNKIK